MLIRWGIVWWCHDCCLLLFLLIIAFKYTMMSTTAIWDGIKHIASFSSCHTIHHAKVFGTSLLLDGIFRSINTNTGNAMSTAEWCVFLPDANVIIRNSLIDFCQVWLGGCRGWIFIFIVLTLLTCLFCGYSHFSCKAYDKEDITVCVNNNTPKTFDFPNKAFLSSSSSIWIVLQTERDNYLNYLIMINC
jgi:hypothetical protein